MRPIKPDKHRSHRERAFRDQVMAAVRKKIYSERIPCSAIIVSNRPMLTAVRARILRGEIDDISLSRALLIADAVGVDLAENLLPATLVPAPKVTLAQVVSAARSTRRRSGANLALGMASLFDFAA